MAVFLYTGSARAEDRRSNVYFAGYMGLSSFPTRDFTESTTPVSAQVDTKNALSFAAALGFRLSPRTRVEAEFGYSKSDLDSISTGGTEFELAGEMKTYTFLLNGYYDFDFNWPVTPFVGAGLGFGIHDGEVDDVAGITIDESGGDMTLMYNVGGGLKYPVSENMAFTGSYRYMGSTDIEFDQTTVGYSAHEFRMGLEYDLPVNWEMGSR